MGTNVFQRSWLHATKRRAAEATGMKSEMKIDRKKFITFFDQKSKGGSHDGSDVSAIIGLLGEDLLLGVLQHFWKSNEGVESEILNYKCNRGTKEGSRLDAWLLKNKRTNGELYQVELKNWAAYALGGRKDLKLDATKPELQAYSKKNWDEHFAPEKIPSRGVRKVLEPMKRPQGYENLTPIPLVCFWFYIGKSMTSPYSKRRYLTGKQVHVFSASAYLRTLKSDYIDIAMPRAGRRMRLLGELILAE